MSPPPSAPASLLAPRSLYVHVPFCRSTCSYCDFYSLPGIGEAAMAATVEATIHRAGELVARFGARELDTVYVGGGTPSILPRPLLRRLLAALGALAPAPLEWTVEANPESLDAEFLDILEGEGVTRLSLGVQSLDPRVISILARPAGAEAALAALGLSAGRRLALSADLIAGLPREGGLAAEALSLVREGAGHLSVYDLILEEGTPLLALRRAGGLALMDEDEAADEREAMEAVLAGAGLGRYEVSNYALPGRESLHNLAYWRMRSWIGAGPGAVSSLVGLAPGKARAGIDGSALRIEEAASIAAYRGEGAAAAAMESVVEPREAAFEVLMMAFRTTEGLDPAAFGDRFGLEPAALVGKTLARWKDRLLDAGGRIALDARGIDLGNAFLADCLLELEETFPDRD